MSVADVRRHLEMMSVLQAEEALTMATAVAVGSGSLKPAASRQIMAEWRRSAGQGRQPIRSPPGTEMLAAIGIKVERQRKKKDAGETR